MRVEVVTTRHWDGDPRLNRHVEHLETGGHKVAIASFRDQSSLQSLFSAVGAVAGTHADAVVLPDPDFYVIGSVVARMSGKRPVIDIHEDYPKVARNRSWIPGLVKPFVSLAARAMLAIGRLLAWRVVVAAPQLSRPGDFIVLNIADPSRLCGHVSTKDPHLLVYVGDITVARGALDMVVALEGLPARYRLMLIGPTSNTTRDQLVRLAEELEVSDRLDLLGRKEHDEAWRIASRAQFGLSLLQDTPAYRHAVATKLWEYLACGLVPIVTDLPGQAAFVSRLDSRLICSKPTQVADIVASLARDDEGIRELSRRGREMAEMEWEKARPDREIQAAFTLDR